MQAAPTAWGGSSRVIRKSIPTDFLMNPFLLTRLIVKGT